MENQIAYREVTHKCPDCMNDMEVVEKSNGIREYVCPVCGFNSEKSQTWKSKPKWMKVNCPKDMTYNADYPTTCSKCKFSNDCMIYKEMIR